ncbi:alpha/beta hydrolase [Sphingomonas solaris]|uniref:Alpha/beta hydrolase n=1 Tax=Alterirhizorhabdus solaris TaxID=2529389 RepID=A0A558R9V0_9SPHN|nr:alpha/beta hydrolase [Sphingomonas solaris]
MAILVPVAGLGVVLGGLYLHSPVQALDTADRLLGGDAPAIRVAEGVPFAPGLALDVWVPPREVAGPHPVLVFFYGGSWVNGRRQDYGFAARAYAERGFVVVVPDYRKVPAARFPAFLRDGAAAVGWAERNAARFGGDPRRLALAGHSAGAWIATMLALDRRWLAAAGVRPDVVRAVVGLAGPYDFSPFRWQAARDALGNAANPRDTQPIRFARRDAPPLWLATGDADDEVRPRNSRALAARQQALGSRTTVLRVYPGLGHPGIVMALSRPFRRLAPVLDDSAAFLRANTAPVR